MSESIELFSDNEIGLIAVNGVPCMDSRDIAKLTEKNHRDVCRDIDIMLEGIKKDARSFAHIYLDSMNREQRCFRLPKRETMILVTGYRVDIRAAVIDRWQYLEEANLAPRVKSREEILAEAHMISAEIIEEQRKKLTLMAPKAEKYDAIVSSVGRLSVEQAAKIICGRLGIELGRNRLFKLLREHSVFLPNNLPRQEHIDAKRFEVKVTTINRGNGPEPYAQAFITPKGLDYICDLISKFAT